MSLLALTSELTLQQLGLWALALPQNRCHYCLRRLDTAAAMSAAIASTDPLLMSRAYVGKSGVGAFDWRSPGHVPSRLQRSLGKRVSGIFNFHSGMLALPYKGEDSANRRRKFRCQATDTTSEPPPFIFFIRPIII